MSEERPDDFFSWRCRLGPPDALPEQGLDDRDMTWEKLAPRLTKASGQVSRRQVPAQSFNIPGQSWYHRLPVYRIAAACLLLLLVPAARLFHNPTPPPTERSVTPPAASSPAVSPSTHLIPQSTERDPLLQSGPTPKELARMQHIINKTPSPRVSVASPHATVPSPRASGPPRTTAANRFPHTTAATAQDSVSPPPSVSIPARPDSPVQISGLIHPPEAAPISSQNTLKNKQLRIVHLNELDNPRHPEPGMTSILSREPDIRIRILLKNH